MRSPRLLLAASVSLLFALGCMCGSGEQVEELLELLAQDVDLAEISGPLHDSGDGALHPPPAPVLAMALSDACAPWREQGQPLGEMAALLDEKGLERAVRRLNLNADCQVEDSYAAQSLYCSFDSDDWSFELQVYRYPDEEDLQWQIQSLEPGQAYRREGSLVIVADAQNHGCATAVFQRFFPAGSKIRDLDEQAIGQRASEQGFSLPPVGCNMSRYAGEVTLECPMSIGPGLEASLYVTYPLKGGQGEEFRWLGEGAPSISQGEANGSVMVSDKPSAEALLRALLG